MPPGGAARSSQTGLDRPTTAPDEFSTCVRTKLLLLVSIDCVTDPPARPEAGYEPMTRVFAVRFAVPA